MSWRTFLFPPLVERDGGLYRPGVQTLNLVKAGLLLAATIGVVAYGQLYVMGAVYLAFAALLGWRYVVDRRRFGAMGRPLVRVHDGNLLFSLPSRLVPQEQSVVLREVKTMTVHGDFTRRRFVFARRHGDPVRVNTSYGRHDERVLAFLQQSLPERIAIEVKEPPAVLGDLPRDD